MNNSDAVVLGKSAGAMNMQSRIYNYPETNEEVGLPKWLNGLGYSPYSIIPHFNTVNGNEYCFGDFDLLQEYYIPDSIGEVLYGIPNGSYIYLEDGVFTLHGEAYTVADGKVTKICNNEEFIVLE
jgi:dipeptidase E